MLGSYAEVPSLIRPTESKLGPAARREGIQRTTRVPADARSAVVVPLPLARIAAVVGEGLLGLLDAEVVVVVAVRVDDLRHLRSVHMAGMPQDGHDRLSAAPRDEASVIAEIDRFLSSHGASDVGAPLAVLPIEQAVCPPGLLAVARAEAQALLRSGAHVRACGRGSLRARARPPSTIRRALTRASPPARSLRDRRLALARGRHGHQLRRHGSIGGHATL